MNKIEPWKLWLSPILLVYSCVLFLGVAPKNQFSSMIIQWILPVSENLGLSQSWELFAPEIDKHNLQIYAFVRFADGATIMVPLPEDEEFPQRALHFKMRQWLHDLVPRTGAIWPETAIFVARRHYSADNPPALVSLACVWSEIPNPHQMKAGVTPKSGSFTFYTRAFRPEELE